MRQFGGKALAGLAPAILILSFSVMTIAGKPPKPEVHNVPGDYPTIQEAIAAADPQKGDSVLVDDGVYVENIDFLGKAITVQSVNGRDFTTIDGGQSGSVVTVTGAGVNSVLDGFTITNGSGTIPPGQATTAGGGIYVLDASPTIRNCRITGNSVEEAGGGVVIMDSPDTEIIDCIISGNSARSGAGIMGSYSTVRIVRCEVTNNTATLGHGGGIANAYGDVTVQDCTISSNTANSYGGGIMSGAASAILTVDSSVISGNQVLNTGPTHGMGGGVYVAGNAKITNCIVSGNTSAYRGGGFAARQEGTVIINSTFSGNSAVDIGGGIYSEASVYVINSNVWDNGSDEIAMDWSGWAGALHSFVKGGWGSPGDNNRNEDPLFVNPVSPALAPTTAGDYHIQEGSPCRDYGINDMSTYPSWPYHDMPTHDVDGDPRSAQSGGDGLNDTGADEYVTVTNPQTIEITGADYDYLTDTLAVDATSGFEGQGSLLYVEGLGNMTWVRQNKWTGTFNGLTVPPANVTVCGVLEGCTVDP